jgi:uncharacterized protein with von Willebrand factor type A (vWA) domain
MLRYDGFEAKAAGIRMMLPYVDEFLPAHNVESLTGLVALLNRSIHRKGRGDASAGSVQRGAAA